LDGGRQRRDYAGRPGFPELENECADYDPTTAKQSPNRTDALVWALTELILDGPRGLSNA
jgi:phage terminase large subunit-like protein